MTNMTMIALAAFTVYRLSILITRESGPWAIFSKLRIYLGCKAADSEVGQGWWNLAEMVHSPMATGVVLAALLSPLVFFSTVPGNIFLVIMAIAGIQAALQDVADLWKE